MKKYVTLVPRRKEDARIAELAERAYNYYLDRYIRKAAEDITRLLERANRRSEVGSR